MLIPDCKSTIEYVKWFLLWHSSLHKSQKVCFLGHWPVNWKKKTEELFTLQMGKMNAFSVAI